MQYKVTEQEAGMQVKEVLKRKLGYSSRLLRKLKLTNGVDINGKQVKLNEVVSCGNRINVVFPEEESYFEPEDIPVSVVFEDEDIFIINKQPGLVVHPTKGHPTGTLANAVTHYMIKASQRYKIRFINRLDRDTSGLIMISKNSFAQENISQQMKNGNTIKKYIALVDGILTEDEDTINLPIDRVEDGIIMRRVVETGQESITKYKVMERFKENTLIELTLLTGRTHQIRVHMSYIGHPVTGDTLYGKEGYSIIQRQALHSFELSLKHPKSGDLLELTAPLPEDMLKSIEICREEAKK